MSSRAILTAIEDLRCAASIPVAFRFGLRKAIFVQHLVIRAGTGYPSAAALPASGQSQFKFRGRRTISIYRPSPSYEIIRKTSTCRVAANGGKTFSAEYRRLKWSITAAMFPAAVGATIHLRPDNK